MRAIVSISSTMIIARVFAERGVSKKLSDLVMGVLVIEDVAAILMLDDEVVRAACSEAQAPGEVVEAVNFNAPGQVVILPMLRENEGDAALLDLPVAGEEPGRLAFTTDAFVVSPSRFPGADIGSLAVFGGASHSTWEYDDNGFDFAFPDQIELLDRTEDIARIGIRYKRASGFKVGVGYEDTQIDFDTPRRDRSNEGSGYVVTIAHTGSHIGAAADVVYRDIQEKDGSQFRDFKAWTGSGRVQYRSESRFGASVFGNRQIVYSLAQGTSYFTDQRLGGSFEMRMGWRTDLRAFVEIGKDEYEPVAGNAQLRTDDFDTIGAEFQMKLRETSTFLAGVSRTTYDSNIDRFDRELTTIRLTINFGGGFLGW